MPPFAVILPAAGRSVRYGRNKLLEPLGFDGSVLARTLMCLWNHEFVDAIYLASDDPDVMAVARDLPPDAARDVHICPGGTTRAHSVQSALRHVPDRYTWIAVHDAARPLVSQELIDRTVAAAMKHGAAAPAMPVASTIKRAVGPLPAKVERTVRRDQLWAMQTPQVMRRLALLDAFNRCPIPLEEVTDDVQLLELAGQDVWLVPGDERNLKITTPLDLKLAELLIRHGASPF